MCGIVGFWDGKADYDVCKVITSMRDALSHRGPDDSGVYIDEENGIALGHRRLSIIDLSPSGRQPMEFDGLVIVYNGEVYNYMKIRAELEDYGYTFFSTSDTEVILKAIHKWGLDAVKKFRGMFAFTLWDSRKKKLILCRDRIGVKPLYWYYKDGFFMFASELKAFHKHPDFSKDINFEALALYLQYGYITAPYSMFKNAFKLEPGSFLIVDKSGEMKKVKYWSLEDLEWEKRGAREEELAEELEEILKESFKLRMVSDVPVGIFLSGGIDSTTVAALLQKDRTRPLKTFTIGFYEKEYDEARYAKKVAEYLGTDHTELYCTPREAFEIIPRLSEIYDEPFGDSSSIPTVLVSKLARKSVKVSLSADGGDEQFYGYTRYWLVGNRVSKLTFLPVRVILLFGLSVVPPEVAQYFYDRLRIFLPKWANFRDKYSKFREVLKCGRLADFYDVSNKYFLAIDLRKLIDCSYKFLTHLELVNSPLSDESRSFMMFYDLKTYLPDDILVKVDRATMSVSLEGRDPLLDHKIIEFSASLPLELKYKNGVSKYLLRKILYKYVPKELVERPKKGFGAPIYEWFKKDLKELYLEYLSTERIKREGIFNCEYVKHLLNDYFEDRGVNHNKLWLLFVFELWYERWMN